MTTHHYLVSRASGVFLMALIFCFRIPLLEGQTSEQKTFTLQQSVRYALQHNATMLNADLDIQIASKKTKEITGTGLPQISLSGDLNYFIEFPTSVIPANAFIPSAPAGEYLAFQFGLPMTSKAGFDVTQLIFSGEYLVGLQAAKTYAELSRRSKERTQADVILQVTKSYYLALMNRERMVLLDANIIRLEKLLKDTRAMNQQGFVEKIDVDRLSVSLSNLKTERKKMESLTEVSLYLLKFQMGFPVAEAITLTDKLSEESISNDIPTDYNPVNRPEFKLIGLQQKMNELDVKRYRAGYLPTLAAYGNASYQAFRADFGDIFTQPVTKRWYPQVLVGLQLRVPIFSGMSQNARVEQAQLALLKSRNDADNLKNAIDLEVSNARVMFNNSLKTLTEQAQNVKLAEEVSRIAAIKYEEGVGSNLEVVTAEAELKTAQTDYINTLFEALTAKVELQKAAGTLHVEP